jgi:hypothetical protein
LFRGQSEELIATWTHGHFIAHAVFAHRVEFLEGAGIVIRNVIPGDRGNYSVEVIHAVTERKTVMVEVTGLSSYPCKA